jgi:tetratricopeptide (TPR) repeat protein
MRAQAMLGRADVLRQLGKKDQAIEVYRALLAESPKSTESENARVALSELGVEIIQPVKRPTSGLPKKEAPLKEEGGGEKLPEKPELAQVELNASMTPEEKCRAIMSKHLTDRTAAVKALTDLSRDEPRIGCVYWYLGNSYRQIGDDRAALAAYRRFIELEPSSERRNAVEQKIKDLATKLEER